MQAHSCDGDGDRWWPSSTATVAATVQPLWLWGHMEIATWWCDSDNNDGTAMMRQSTLVMMTMLHGNCGSKSTAMMPQRSTMTVRWGHDNGMTTNCCLRPHPPLVVCRPLHRHLKNSWWGQIIIWFIIGTVFVARCTVLLGFPMLMWLHCFCRLIVAIFLLLFAAVTMIAHRTALHCHQC